MPLRILITVRILISLSLVLLAAQVAHGQTAEDFFNRGAQFYISNNIPHALVSVEKGLKAYPDDVKLKKLYELLKQQNRQQSKNNQSRQNQQKQSQQQKSQNNQKHQKSNQQKNQQKQNQSEQKKQQPPAQSSAEPSKEKHGGQKKQRPAEAHNQMTPEEARRLLNAQKGDEQFLQLKPHAPPRNSQKPVEDW